MKIYLLVIALLLSHNICCDAQSDIQLTSDFSAQIKSMDEFIQRFNGVESHPEIHNGTDHRTANLWALFDHRLITENKNGRNMETMIEEFISIVEHDSITLSLLSPQMSAVADVIATIDGKQAKLQLTFRQQIFKKAYLRWAMVNVKGISTSRIIDFDGCYGISPIEHEKNFMGLSDIFTYNCKDIMGYRGTDTEIDELSVFLTLAWMNKVRIENITDLTFYCYEVPGYVFTINEIVRRGNNSGWLISNLSILSDSEKGTYITKSDKL